MIVRFSSDGTKVIIGCKNDRVFIWDWQKRDASLKEVILPVFGTVEIACDRNMIYTCSWNMHVCKIDLGSLQISTVRQGLPRPVVSPDGKAILFGTLQENVFLYCELLTGRDVKYNAGGYMENYFKLLIIISH